MGLRDISIRKFRTEDAKAVARIISNSLSEAMDSENNEEVTPKSVLSLSNKRKMYVALNDNKIVGTAGIDHDTIYTVFVDADYHGQDVEEALVSLMEEIVANNGFMVIRLEARVTEHRLFERLGYSTVGEVTASEFGQCVMMDKSLI